MFCSDTCISARVYWRSSISVCRAYICIRASSSVRFSWVVAMVRVSTFSLVDSMSSRASSMAWASSIMVCSRVTSLEWVSSARFASWVFRVSMLSSIPVIVVASIAICVLM